MRVTRIVTVAAAILSAGAITPVLAQRSSGPPLRWQRPAGVDRVTFIAQTYTTLATLDVNRDGTLDAAEAEAVDSRVASGDLVPPPFRADNILPPDWVVRMHAARLYQGLALYDRNRDGVLDDAERDAVAAAWFARRAGPPWARRGGP